MIDFQFSVHSYKLNQQITKGEIKTTVEVAIRLKNPNVDKNISKIKQKINKDTTDQKFKKNINKKI